MANEVNTLNIGGTSYPIYSEGIKIDTSKNDNSNGKFLVATGNSGNQTIGTSSAITGNDEELSISSGYIELGTSANTVNLGNTADGVFIGGGATNVDLGQYASYIYIGESADLIVIGCGANNVSFGQGANNVNLGEFATNIDIATGKTTTAEDGTVTKHTTTKIGENNSVLHVGQYATNISIGEEASSIYLGTGAGSVSLGVEATNVSLGYSAERIQLGDFASELNIGFDASQISIGPNVHQDVDRNTIGINNVGELYITGTHTDITGEDYESYINMEYDSGSGAMDLNLAAGATGVINIGGTGAHQSSMLNINSDNISLNGSATIDINGTNGIQMTGSNFNFIVQPNVSTVDGFNIRHQKNSSIGIVCYTPSASAPVLYMTPRVAHSSSATVHLGTTSKRFGALYVNAGYATTSFTSSSDERLKDFGENIEVDLDALAALRKSYYRWNETSGFENEKDRMLGMSAQEVQKIYPEVVATDEDGMLSMAYDRLSVVALAAIDKLHNENKELKAENEDLKDRIANLENLVDTILSRIN